MSLNKLANRRRIRSNLSIPVSLYDVEVFSWKFFNGALELFGELFHKIVVIR